MTLVQPEPGEIEECIHLVVFIFSHVDMCFLNVAGSVETVECRDVCAV